jgi:hypothetical protein
LANEGLEGEGDLREEEELDVAGGSDMFSGIQDEVRVFRMVGQVKRVHLTGWVFVW